MNVEESGRPGRPVLIVRAGSLCCALPLAHVVETMRPQPLQALRAAPDVVLGVATIRGVATPVVDLAAVLTGEPAPVRRLVTLKTEAGPAALAVSDVIGASDLDELATEPLPPLLADARADAVASLARLDGALVVVLEGAQVIPDAVRAAEAR